MNSKKEILLTGSTGYLGKSLKSFLENRNVRVVTLGRKQGRFQVDIDWDLRSTSFELPQADYLIHCAWDLTQSQWNQSYEINVLGSKRLFEAFLKKNPAGKIIFISSASAYSGNSTSYGKSKLMVESFLRPSQDLILRPGLLYQESNYMGLVGLLQKLTKKVPLLPFPLVPKENLFFCKISLVESLVEDFVKSSTPHLQYTYYVGEKPFLNLKSILLGLKGERLFPILVPIPWQIIYFSLRLVEFTGLKLRLRSDGLMSLNLLPTEDELENPHWYSAIKGQ